MPTDEEMNVMLTMQAAQSLRAQVINDPARYAEYLPELLESVDHLTRAASAVQNQVAASSHLNHKQLCARCAKGKEPFTPKSDHPEWVQRGAFTTLEENYIWHPPQNHV